LQRPFPFEGRPLDLANVVRDGENKGSSCVASSSSHLPDLLISTGEGATGVPCGSATVACTACFVYTAIKDLVRNRKRREIAGFFIWEGLCFPLHLLTPYYVIVLVNMVNTTRTAHRPLKH